MNYGFIKVAAASPKLKIANIEYNTDVIKQLIFKAHGSGVKIIAFPELSLTGYTCGDLFLQRNLIISSIEAIKNLAESTANLDILAIIGLPFVFSDRLYNCACVFSSGKILGLVPKMFLPNKSEFYEKRWFTSGNEISKQLQNVNLGEIVVPFGHLLFVNEDQQVKLGVEICEDLWSVIPPSSHMALNGANLIVNLSASNELVGKSEYRRKLVEQQSARCIAGYIYAGSSVYESTTDLVFGGHCIISENGEILGESERFTRDNQIIISDIDLEKLSAEKGMQSSYTDDCDRNWTQRKFAIVYFKLKNDNQINSLDRMIHPYPFVPTEQQLIKERCEEIVNIQSTGLAKRIEHTSAKKAVIAVSGGIDSTLALLIVSKTFDLIGRDKKDIIGITMPGFGTTDKTYHNAIRLMKSLNIDDREIDIKPACNQHMKDIGHNPKEYDVVFENIQARERMQILMDIANKENGLVVGTSDLSELALGWTTYNGDHMSMYGINSGIPKTLVKFLVRWVAENHTDLKTRSVLMEIIDTPISPELLPPDTKGRISQKTEEQIGSFDLHDFFLYYSVRWGMTPGKIMFLATKAFDGIYGESYIKETLYTFYCRFFSQQFKRSALPDGPKIGSIGLSPRGDWKMPSDADSKLWITGIENKSNK